MRGFTVWCRERGGARKKTFCIECSFAQPNTFALIPSMVSFSPSCITSLELLCVLLFSHIFKRLLLLWLLHQLSEQATFQLSTGVS